MKREELFLAIGEVEESRLMRTELAVEYPSDGPGLEEKTMKKHRKTSKTIRSILIAAVIVSTLALTAFAVSGLLLFDTPAQMLNTLFGDRTGYDHSDGSITRDPHGGPEAILVEPTFDRVPVDETLVKEELEPLVEAVGQSISWYGYTLTVDANLYDAATRCGVVTYTLENPEGIKPYEVHPDGEFYFPGGELVQVSQSCNQYIIQEKTTDTKLAVTCYYQYDPEHRDKDLELTFYTWAAISPKDAQQYFLELLEQKRTDVSQDEAYALVKNGLSEEDFAQLKEMNTDEEIAEQGYSELAQQEFNKQYQCPDSIRIALNEESALTNATLADGAITVSAVAMRIDGNMLGMENVDSVKIHYADGTGYVVCEGYTINYTYAAWNTEGVLSVSFNRIIDVEKIDAVLIDGEEYTIE